MSTMSTTNKESDKKDYLACTGCGLCALPCPTWVQFQNISYTPWGRAKALQGGATAAEIIEDVASCLLCGACQSVCPENIDIIEQELKLRNELHSSEKSPFRFSEKLEEIIFENQKITGQIYLTSKKIPKEDIKIHTAFTKQNIKFLEIPVPKFPVDLEMGKSIDHDLLNDFIFNLSHTDLIITDNSWWYRLLLNHFSGKKVLSLGEWLIKNKKIQNNIQENDFYWIDSRIFHNNYEKLVLLYNSLKEETLCTFNWTLQRSAQPLGSQAIASNSENFEFNIKTQYEWVIQGRKINRIIVENKSEWEWLRENATFPVFHISELIQER